MNNTSTIQRFSYLLDTIPALLYSLPSSMFNDKPQSDKWSKKEILGHLIDSAANNHQRFVRGQFEENPRIVYAQDNWVKYSYHQSADEKLLIGFWELYNRMLLHIMKQTPVDLLQRTCDTAGPEPFTIDFLMDDYVVHMEHHLKEIVSYT